VPLAKEMPTGWGCNLAVRPIVMGKDMGTFSHPKKGLVPKEKVFGNKSRKKQPQFRGESKRGKKGDRGSEGEVRKS